MAALRKSVQDLIATSDKAFHSVMQSAGSLSSSGPTMGTSNPVAYPCANSEPFLTHLGTSQPTHVPQPPVLSDVKMNRASCPPLTHQYSFDTFDVVDAHNEGREKSSAESVNAVSMQESTNSGAISDGPVFNGKDTTSHAQETSPKPVHRLCSKEKTSSSNEAIAEKSIDDSLDSADHISDMHRSSDSNRSVDTNSSRNSAITDSISLSRESKDRKESRNSDKEKDKKKKSSWYNMLYPTYKSRSEDFRRIFKDLPPDERLIVDYSCAIQRDILVHGRIYLSPNYVSFYANIFRWETCVTIRLKDVVSVTKEKTALVIPNAIQVSTENEKYFFTSFGARDKTFLMVFKVWQNALMDQPLSSQELWQWVHACYGDELGLTSEDDDYVAPDINEADLNEAGTAVTYLGPPGIEPTLLGGESPMSTPSLALDTNLMPPSPSISSRMSSSPSVSPSVALPSLHGTIPLSKSASAPPNSLGIAPMEIPTDLSDNSSGSDGDKVSRRSAKISRNKIPQCTAPHEGREVLNVIVPMHVDQLFTVLFTNSKFFLDFLTSQRTWDIIQSPWQLDSETGRKLRQLSFTIALNNPMGPKQAAVTQTQVMLSCSRPGWLYAIDKESVNSGIPYADTFTIFSHYCIVRHSDTESRLTVRSEVKYKKSVWGIVRAFIEKNTYPSIEDYYNSLGRELLAECEQNVTTKARRRKRAVRSMSRNSRNDEDDNENRGAIPMLPHNGNTRGSIAAAMLPRSENSATSRTDFIVKIVFGVLMVLLFLNALLYYKLWSLEKWTEESARFPPIIDLQMLRKEPQNHNDWVNLLQQQETLHQMETDKWQQVLRTAIKLLKEAEESLSGLQDSLQPRQVKFSNLVHDIIDPNNKGSDSNPNYSTGEL